MSVQACMYVCERVSVSESELERKPRRSTYKHVYIQRQLLALPSHNSISIKGNVQEMAAKHKRPRN